MVGVCRKNKSEAKWVNRKNKDLISAGHKGSDIAVLFRTNAQSALFEQALSDADISYQVRGAERFFNRREVRDGILQLRAAAKTTDDDVGEAVIPRIKNIMASMRYTAQATKQYESERKS